MIQKHEEKFSKIGGKDDFFNGLSFKFKIKGTAEDKNMIAEL